MDLSVSLLVGRLTPDCLLTIHAVVMIRAQTGGSIPISFPKQRMDLQQSVVNSSSSLVVAVHLNVYGI
jgi:hypothetical protein